MDKLNKHPEHAPSPAGASIESHNASEPTGKPENSEAGDGCCVSSCWLLFCSHGAALATSKIFVLIEEVVAVVADAMVGAVIELRDGRSISVSETDAKIILEGLREHSQSRQG